jgi:hypothetical protein
MSDLVEHAAYDGRTALALTGMMNMSPVATAKVFGGKTLQTIAAPNRQNIET